MDSSECDHTVLPPPAAMFAQLAVTVALALSSAATPVVVRDNLITLPLARRFNITGSKTVHQRDQARAQGFRHATRARTRTHSHTAASAAASATSFVEPVTNSAVSYIASVSFSSERAGDHEALRSGNPSQVSIGSPAQTCEYGHGGRRPQTLTC